MSELFISHSNVDRDRQVAQRVSALLDDLGHTSVFLAFDPELGISSGSEWERELYRRLRACKAVVALCSEHSMASKWCFAEITLAKANGKAILPIVLDSCDLPQVLSELQTIDWDLGEAEARDRLGRGLRAVGLDPRDDFEWQRGERPPYPGLPFFEEEDAGVFFGRDGAIQECLQTLNRVRRGHGKGRWILVHGASGCGKSSLIRAGIVPRVRRDPDHWRMVGPFVPGTKPLQALAQALANADVEGIATWRTLQEELESRTVEDAAGWLNGFAHDLAVGAGLPEAGVLVITDQLEETLHEQRSDEDARFLAILRSALADPAGRIVGLSAIRSDFLDRFQAAFTAGPPPFEGLPLNPVNRADLAQIIQGPATIDGLELEEGLVEALLKDTDTDDALPLLAFALRELYERFGRDDGSITVSEYENGLEGIQGALTRAAEKVWKRTPSDSRTRTAVRDALVSLVRQADNGRYVRRRVSWETIPKEAEAPLKEFVEARLLISSSDGESRTLEVAHEALIRDWSTLRGWVEEAAGTLAWRRRLEVRVEHWEQLRTQRPTPQSGKPVRLWIWLRTRLPIPPAARRKELRDWGERWERSLLSAPEVNDVLDQVPQHYWDLAPRESLDRQFNGLKALKEIAKDEGWFSRPLWREVRKSKPMLRPPSSELPEGVPERWRRAWRFQSMLRSEGPGANGFVLEGIPEVDPAWLRQSLALSESRKTKIFWFGQLPIPFNVRSAVKVIGAILFVNGALWVAESFGWRQSELILANAALVAPLQVDLAAQQMATHDPSAANQLRGFVAEQIVGDSVELELPDECRSGGAPKSWLLHIQEAPEAGNFLLIPIGVVEPSSRLEVSSVKANLIGDAERGGVRRLTWEPGGGVLHLGFEPPRTPLGEEQLSEEQWECEVRSERGEDGSWTLVHEE